MKRRGGVLGALLLSAPGALGATACCTHQVRVAAPIRYRLALDGNAPPGSRECFRGCLPRYASGTHAFWACLVECPGMKVTENARCSPNDQPPRAVCGEAESVRHSTEVERRPFVATAVLGGVAGLVAGFAAGVVIEQGP